MTDNVQLNAPAATDRVDDFGLIDYASPSVEPTYNEESHSFAEFDVSGDANDDLIDFDDAEADNVGSNNDGEEYSEAVEFSAGTEPVLTAPTESVVTEYAEPVVTEPAESVVTEYAEPIGAESVDADVSEPVVTESSEPNVAEPVDAYVSEPIVTEPAESVVAEFVVTESAEPVVTEPTEPYVTDIAEPDFDESAEPVVAEAADYVTEPVITEPEEFVVMESVVIESVEPVVTEPVELDIAETESIAPELAEIKVTVTDDTEMTNTEITNADNTDTNEAGVAETWVQSDGQWMVFLGRGQSAYSEEDQKCLFGMSVADLIDVLQTDCGLAEQDLALEFPSLGVVLDKRDPESHEHTLEGLYMCHRAAVQVGGFPVDYVNTFLQLQPHHAGPLLDTFIFVLHTRPRLQQALSRIMEIKQQAEDAAEGRVEHPEHEQNGTVDAEPQADEAEEEDAEGEDEAGGDDVESTTAALLDDAEDEDDDDDEDFVAEDEEESDHVLDADAVQVEDEVDAAEEDAEAEVDVAEDDDAEAEDEVEVEEISDKDVDEDMADEPSEVVEIVEDDDGAKTRVDSVSASPSNKRTKAPATDEAELIDEPAMKKAKANDAEPTTIVAE
ncbi:hypothetical protein LPJ67_001749 [Coemansia sp. RSA 1938]|nr:hypothetical protein LPJ67_001749 [Coemansia sp. RSA 1938]